MNDRFFATMLGLFFMASGAVMTFILLAQLQTPLLRQMAALLCLNTAACMEPRTILLPVAAMLMVEGVFIVMARAITNPEK